MDVGSVKITIYRKPPQSKQASLRRTQTRGPTFIILGRPRQDCGHKDEAEIETVAIKKTREKLAHL